MGRVQAACRLGGTTHRGLHGELNGLGDPRVVAKAEYWRKLVPRVRAQVGALGVMGEGAGAHRGEAELSAGTAQCPVWSVLPPGLRESLFHPSTTGRRGLCPRAGARDSAFAGRSEGWSPRCRRAAPGTRPGDARWAPTQDSGEVLPAPARNSRGGFREDSRGERVDIAFYVEVYFQSSSRGKSVFAGVAFA